LHLALWFDGCPRIGLILRSGGTARLPLSARGTRGSIGLRRRGGLPGRVGSPGRGRRTRALEPSAAPQGVGDDPLELAVTALSFKKVLFFQKT